MDDSDDDDPNGEIHRKNSPKFPSRPSFPSVGGAAGGSSQPSPPVFGRFPPIRHDEDDDGDDNDPDNSVSIEANNIPGLGVLPPGIVGGGGSRSGVGGGSSSPVDTTYNRKPINVNNPSIVIKPSLGTTPRPPTSGTSGGDVRRNPTSGGTLDAATKTVAVFKLFTPILVSMLGKLVSLS